MIRGFLFLFVLTVLLVSCKEHYNKHVVKGQYTFSKLRSGKQLYSTNCAVCHKEDGSGDIGPNLTDSYWMNGRSFDEVKKVIRLGMTNGMPEYRSKLKDNQIDDLTLYVLSLPYKKGKRPQGVDLNK
jgi:cytochrome c oxidase cbb3-type subunit 3